MIRLDSATLRSRWIPRVGIAWLDELSFEHERRVEAFEEAVAAHEALMARGTRRRHVDQIARAEAADDVCLAAGRLADHVREVVEYVQTVEAYVAETPPEVVGGVEDEAEVPVITAVDQMGRAASTGEAPDIPVLRARRRWHELRDMWDDAVREAMHSGGPAQRRRMELEPLDGFLGQTQKQAMPLGVLRDANRFEQLVKAEYGESAAA